MDRHQAKYRLTKNKHRTIYKLANIHDFGAQMPGSHPDVQRREFRPLEKSRAWAEFQAAADRAHQWWAIPSLVK